MRLNSNQCSVCGKIAKEWICKDIISNELASSWQLITFQRKQFNVRESSFCPNCGNSMRTRALAQAIIEQIQLPKVVCLIDWIKKANKKILKVAEINSCGKLHQELKRLHNLKYSEYNPTRYQLPFWKRWQKPDHQDIQQLSYQDNTFDLVLHSEVLEHVPDYHKALTECLRILKPKGICLFTVPLIPKRKTKECSKYNEINKEVYHIKPPSYHGSGSKNDFLVWWEFGGDFIKNEKIEVVFRDNKSLSYVYKISKKAS